MIHTAYLRVYLPRERAGDWRSHDSPHAAPKVVRVDDRFLWQEPIGDDAFSTVWNEKTYMCPRFPRLRMLEGVIAFSETFPAPALVPERAVKSAANELARLRSSAPWARSHILSSPWHVPLRWFAAFEPGWREIYEAPFGLSIRYRGYVGEGRSRVGRAVTVLEEAGFDESVVRQVRDLERWLSEFSRDGMLELDYARVAQLFSGGDLVLDESGAEVNASLDALSTSDYEQAGVKYAQVATRWAPVQALTYVN